VISFSLSFAHSPSLTLSLSLSLSISISLGQEEGNVDFVLEHKFGDYQSEHDPHSVAKKLCSWLQDVELLHEMSQGAMKAGNPHAAEDIVRKIGTSVLRWKELHPDEEKDRHHHHQQQQQQHTHPHPQHQQQKACMNGNKMDYLRPTLNSQISQASC
jgi:hypothetical protein